jgi:preprotein translocase SecE subunit
MEPDKPAKKSKKDDKKSTMREVTEKSAEKDNKPKRRSKILKIIAKPFRPIGRFFIRIERWKPIHLIGLVIVPRYFRNSAKELRLVTWPNRRETRRLTTAVLIFAIIFGVLIALVDYGLDKIFKKVILKQ